MQPALILYARGAVDDVIEVLCATSKDLGQTLWSIEGKPCTMRVIRPKIAVRVCIIDDTDVDLHQIPEDKVLGTAHVSRVAHFPSKCRISFYLEDLSGEPLSSPNERMFNLFCKRFVMLLENKGIKIGESRNDAETEPLSMPPLAQNDTGPLPA